MLVGIVDDEIYYSDVLKNKLKDYIQEEDEVRIFNNAEDFTKDLLNKCEYDILFLDIEIGCDNGIDLALKVNEVTPCTQIIFVTSYVQYVSDVYQSKHMFFMDKERIDEYFPIAYKHALKNYIDIKSKYLTISWNKEKIDIYQKDILYIERQLRVSYIYTTKEVYKTSLKIDELMGMLNNTFCVCHMSFIVGMNYIKNIKKNSIKLLDGKEIPLSRSQYKKMIDSYNYFISITA